MGDKPKDPPDAGERYDTALAKTGAIRVSSVEGRPITRYGTPIFIGAVRDPENGKKLVYTTSEVVTIPRDEAERFRREYVRHIIEGDLVLVDQPEGGAPRNVTTTGSPGAVAKGPPHAADESRRE
jgi:hypothetical protein